MRLLKIWPTDPSSSCAVVLGRGSSAPGLLQPEGFGLDSILLGEESGGTTVPQSWDSRGSCPVMVRVAALETPSSWNGVISREEILADGTVVCVSWS